MVVEISVLQSFLRVFYTQPLLESPFYTEDLP